MKFDFHVSNDKDYCPQGYQDLHSRKCAGDSEEPAAPSENIFLCLAIVFVTVGTASLSRRQYNTPTIYGVLLCWEMRS